MPTTPPTSTKLLEDLAAGGPGERTARFRTVVVAAWPDGREVLAHGVVEGRIVGERRGDRGFGYDPVFVPSPGYITFAEMSLARKSAIGHRGRALRLLAQLLAERS